MPTAAKLIAALFFAMLGYFAADLSKQVLPAGGNYALLSPVCGILGVCCGWIMAGRRAGDGMISSLGYGVTTSALIAFWALVIFAGREMVKKSMHFTYDGAVEAVQGWVEIGLTYGKLICTPEVIGTLIVGGMLGGYLAEFAARRWR